MSFPRLHKPNSQLFVPDDAPPSEALARISHLAIGAHSDDLEVMAYHGIVTCFGDDELSFGGVTCTNGAGCSRRGPYAALSDEEMAEIRRLEQRKAAVLGEYGFVAQLDYASEELRGADASNLRDDLETILRATHPFVVFAHNPADKHRTHIAVLLATIEALRELPPDERPKTVLGCEVWRNLDWLHDSEKVLLDTSGRPSLAAALLGAFDSQITGGKRYDLATIGRWHANATFFDSHHSDSSASLAYAIDLTPLVADPTRDIVDFTLSAIDRFRADVETKLRDQLESLGGPAPTS